ncbi:MAG: FAD-dependent oxidoreductase [Nitrospirae bacterium]|nr:FAD-dependent oxidoreductase [Nitrospirota bacterium]
METTIVLGGGLAGLSAGYALTKAGKRVLVFEADSSVGGLSRTIVSGDFRFDLGGHRFFTKNKKIETFVKDLMKDELLSVSRKSKIYLRENYFDYPLKPLNSISGLGLSVTTKIILDYGKEKLTALINKPNCISLEDWVISNFGKTMFNLYFKEYSEKVWGIDCRMISQDWVAKRIQGLSLGAAIKNAFFKFSGKKIPTLADRFLYPCLGIGRISERLKEEITKNNPVHTETTVRRLIHKDFKIVSMEAKNCDRTYTVDGERFISSIPLSSLVKILHPEPPSDVLHSASSLNYRDLVIVAVMVNRQRVTDQTWIYIPEAKIPFGRLHEPKNWSPYMAPEDKTLLVIEFFCFKNDSVWSLKDNELTDLTVRHLDALGLIKKEEVFDSLVIRVPKAYPLFEVGYDMHVKNIISYLDGFKNLHIIGRGGLFRYYNMDHAIESGIEAASL